ncbi:hypothetical protein EUAN_23960 [Andreesenia angusta]|uniref:Sugar-specific transcriptional regulator TrmB n=1 Tax=Andreesenia angusta TaxID=39480 RepID=A0A1S1V6A8_9FIRM|nr:helix-turn-helix domain-containing protein [Andreesenia angusta]OHW61239.1 hypothetical protein EUAN_23960 [Andreesenia angusta]
MKSYDINAVVSANMAEQYGLTFMERGFYEILRSFKCNTEHTATPGIGTIAKAMGCCRNTAKKYIDKLVEKGLIWKTERPVVRPDGRKWNDTHLYTFVAEKHGKPVFQESRDVKVQTESPYQKIKTTFEEARNELRKLHGKELCDRAFKICIRNLRTGVTSYVKNPLNYMKSVIKNIVKESALEKAQKEYANSFDESDVKDESNAKKQEKPRYAAPYSQPRKTAFHNFEQRSSKYSNDDLEALIKEKNGRR